MLSGSLIWITDPVLTFVIGRFEANSLGFQMSAATRSHLHCAKCRVKTCAVQPIWRLSP